MTTATICTIGDEILIGQIVDTNSSMIAKALESIGVQVVEMVSTSDSAEEIESTLNRCSSKSNVVIITGGLGPTKDDITKTTIARLTGARSYINNDEQFAVNSRILAARGIEMSAINRDQSKVPDTCKVIVNKVGTAPCMEFQLNGALMFSMPGVPFETETALPQILASIQEHFNLATICHRTICTFGIAESTLSDMIEDWENNLPDNMHLAYLPNSILGVRLRISIYGTNKEDGEKAIDLQIEKLKDIIGDAIYGYGEDSLQKVLGDILLERNATVATAESCTGGKIAELFTSIAGASRYYWGSVVSYDNSVKINTLKVRKSTIDTYGAVSSQTVEEMAEGVRKLLGTDYAVATSGIAGPGGGSAEKPAGTVWVGVSGKNFTVSKMFRFSGRRDININRFASHALNFLRLNILADK